MRMLSEEGGVYHVADIHKNKYFFYLVSFFFNYRMVNFPILYGRMFLVALESTQLYTSILSHRHHVGTDLNAHFSDSQNVYFLSKSGSHTPKYFYSKFLHSRTVELQRYSQRFFADVIYVWPQIINIKLSAKVYLHVSYLKIKLVSLKMHHDGDTYI